MKRLQASPSEIAEQNLLGVASFIKGTTMNIKLRLGMVRSIILKLTCRSGLAIVPFRKHLPATIIGRLLLEVRF
ncbi:hypothetical protein DC094_09425 [Pelagibaculum spongiae]|uniref:Uncharacterized protein n=1 Tax=Pelagibaculum spongiae TaxID=2080658 RepID=A0A2V1H2L5_9GAMM|nr:hypothetical protein DC094_09425 [Pelagibaculum spongiae]